MTHTALLLVAVALALGSSLGCWALLGFVGDAARRRLIQLLGLALPAVVIGIALVLMIHFFTQVCFWTAPPPDVLVTQALTAAGALSMSGVLGLNGLRVVLLPWHFTRRTWPAPPWLVTEIRQCLPLAGLRRLPAARVAADARPWALVAGLLQPCVVLSSGLVGLLDREERQAVLLHELLHIRRRDLWWTAVGGALRDLSWFLPPVRRLYAHLVAEQELACDNSIRQPRHRLALASALARVWHAQQPLPALTRGTLMLLSAPTVLAYEVRIQRLLEPAGREETSPWPAITSLLLGTGGLVLAIQLSITQWAMVLMGCGLHELLPIFP